MFFEIAGGASNSCHCGSTNDVMLCTEENGTTSKESTRQPGNLPSEYTTSRFDIRLVSQLPEGAEGFEDSGDLLGAFGGLFAEEGGEGF